MTRTATLAPPPPGLFQGMRSRVPRLTIRDKILGSFLIAIAVLSSVTAMWMVRSLQYNNQYADMLDNATIANEINGFFKPTFDSEMWDVVAGKTEFAEGEQYQLIEQLEGTIGEIMARTDSTRGRLKLDVILRTVRTLRHYVDLMGVQIAADASVYANEIVLDNIRGITDLIQELLRDYMIFEVDRMGQKSLDMQRNYTTWAAIAVAMLIMVITFSVLAAWRISAGIYLPIKRLHDVTTGITQRDVSTLVRSDNVDEITELGMSFNLMVGQIRELLDAKVREQEQLKKAEFKALQAQINPHFLYNTLDTIIWKAEANQKEQVIALVQALSSFFRITLSKGRDWIDVRDEVEHVRSYLAIQQMRYRDILTYEMEMDPGILDETVLKLTLQPLVENAIYHGIKNKRGGGCIRVSGRQLEGERLLFIVEDNGIGLSAARLAEVRAVLDGAAAQVPNCEGGLGLRNVSERIKLYYGTGYGLQIDSVAQLGTTVRVMIPRTAN